MAKRHGSKRGASTSHYNYTATPRVLGPSLSSLVLQNPMPSRFIIPEPEMLPFMDEVEDRRRFDADPSKPARTASGQRARFRALYNAPLQTIGFQDPRRVLICVRRKARREVLFAKRQTGRGAKARRHRRNQYSNVRC